MDKINVKLYNTRYPNTNYEYFDSLTDIEKEEYLQLYLKYSDMLYIFLIEKLELKKLDNLLNNSNYNFKIVKEKDMDFYQKLGSKYLKYFYIRNNIFIERLTESEKEYLKQVDINALNNYDFIENTYLKICLEDMNSNSMVNYGPDHVDFYKPQNGIIIGYRYDDFDKEENEDEDLWFKKHNKRILELDFLNVAFNKLVNNKLKTKVYLVRYNEYSVFINKEA